MKLSAHLGFQFTEVPFIERFASAARAGFTGVEFPCPYDHALPVLKEQLDRHGLHLVQFSAPAGDAKAGEKGLAPFASRIDEYRQGIETALEYALYLGCPKIHVMAGIVTRDSNAEWDVYVANIRAAVERFAEAGITTLVEMMSPLGMPDFYLSSFERVERLFNEITNPDLQLLVDTFHVSALGHDVVTTLEEWLPKTGHIQIADYPGRHEPGTGSLPFEKIFETLQRMGYPQWVGCEYHPLGDTVVGLECLSPYLTSPESRHFA